MKGWFQVGTLTKRQNDFILQYVETRNIYQSAIQAGYSHTYAKSRSHELLKNPLISEQITNLTESLYKEHFQEIATTAIKKLSEVVQDSENRSTQLQAIKYTLEQAGVTNTEQETGTIEIKVKLPSDL